MALLLDAMRRHSMALTSKATIKNARYSTDVRDDFYEGVIMVRTNNNQFGILRNLQKKITYYTGIRVCLRSTDDAFVVLFDDSTEMQGLNLPKKDGLVEDRLFEEAVNFLQELLEESVA